MPFPVNAHVDCMAGATVSAALISGLVYLTKRADSFLHSSSFCETFFSTETFKRVLSFTVFLFKRLHFPISPSILRPILRPWDALKFSSKDLPSRFHSLLSVASAFGL